MSIRYDKKFMNEIRRTVRNYNRKISRLEKKGGYLTPPKASIPELKANYLTRRDLRYRLRQLQKFSERGIEETIITKAGAKTTAYELTITKQNIRRAKSYYTRKLKMVGGITPKVGGKKQARTLAQMGDSSISNIRAKLGALTKGKLEDLSQDALRKLSKFSNLQILRIGYQDMIFKENYIKGIEDAIAYGAIDKEQGEKIKSMIENMSAKKFYEMYKSEKDFETLIDNHRVGSNTRIMMMDEYEYNTFETNLQAGFQHIEDDLGRLIQEYS